jgi:FkbM family methyltransferase
VSEHAKHRQAGLVERVAARLPDPVFARTIALVHPRVEPEMRRVIAACPRDGTAVDVGAWYGPWTRWLSRHMDAVVAFEANPKVAAVLRATAPSNAVIHAVAVSDRDGETLELAVSGGRGREGRSSVEARLAEGSERVRVPTRRLDSFDLDRVRSFGAPVSSLSEIIRSWWSRSTRDSVMWIQSWTGSTAAAIEAPHSPVASGSRLEATSLSIASARHWFALVVAVTSRRLFAVRTTL